MLVENKENIHTGKDSSGNVWLKFLLFTAAMFTLPFVSYYYVKDAAMTAGVGSPRDFIYGTISAVVIVNLIIAAYVYVAFLEERIDRRAKIDADAKKTS